MAYNNISFAGFKGRNEELTAIKRWKGRDIKQMFYRTNVYFHSQRVLWLVEELLPYAVDCFPQFNAEKARTLALVHDDLEILTGDITLNVKQRMKEEQKKKMAKEEAAAREILSEHYPKTINGFIYQELLEQTSRKESKEAQLVSCADKRDGWGEGIHEVYAGNKERSFLRGVRDYEAEYFLPQRQKWPLIALLFDLEHPFLDDPMLQDLETIVDQGKGHTLESIYQETGNQAYDLWKKITLERAGPESLIRRVE